MSVALLHQDASGFDPRSRRTMDLLIRAGRVFTATEG
ncbi:MAG: hypothetical protein AVDCRST_MAG93-8971, partial [uncultured Chloroflexia bacterium]